VRITFGPTRRQLETFAVIPFVRESSPRYAPHGQLMITVSTGFPLVWTPSDPYP
jgi:hypothetical protein